MKSKKIVKNQRRIPKQQRALAKYNAVLGACTQVLIEKGYQKSSVHELSLASDVAVPTIYQYFDSKEDIFQQWFSQLGDKVFEDLLEQAINKQEDDLVYAYLKESMQLIMNQRAVVKKLLYEFPQALSSQLVTDLEQQTLAFVAKLIGASKEQIAHPKLILLTQLLLSHMLQITFYSDREVDIEFEARELSKITQYYLQQI